MWFGQQPERIQEEYRNRRRNEEFKRSHVFFGVFCVGIVLMGPQWTSAGIEKCAPKPRCWKRAPTKDISFKDGQLVKKIHNETSCKEICYNNENCTGIYWGFQSSLNKVSCWLQVSSQGDSESLTNANIWIFSDCTDDCPSYCWKPELKNVKAQGGKVYRTAQTEARCKETCANDHMCDGVDWLETTKSCWHDSRHKKTLPKEPYQHWDIVRTTQTQCSKAEEQCMPHCWTKTNSPELNFRDGKFMKGIDNEQNCTEYCANSPTCIGVYWGSNSVLKLTTCWLQMPSSVVSESLTDVNHWTLSNCTDDCLPYCWRPKLEFVVMNGGIIQDDIDEEIPCKVKCARDKECAGADFITTDKKCFLFYDDALNQEQVPDPFDHWEIVRNLPKICSSQSSGDNETGGAPGEISPGDIAPDQSSAVENATAENSTAEKATKEAEGPERCKKNCWKKSKSSEDISFNDGLFTNGTANETECRHGCTNNELCIGAYWGFKLDWSIVGCWLQMPNKGGADSLTNADHWTLSKCTDDCFSYCWKPRADNVSTLSGVYKGGVDNEDHCKSLCSSDPLCDGAEWNIANVSCHNLFKHKRTTAQVNHWEIIRNLPTNCTKSSDPQCTPHCWNKTVLPDVSFKDGKLTTKVKDENACKKYCVNDQTCIGVYWGVKNNSAASSCWLQQPFSADSESLTTVNHWSLNNCSGDCLPYCWMPKWDFIQTAGGQYQRASDENQCKEHCADDEKCQGLDWSVTSSGCYLLHDIKLVLNQTSDPTRHWEIERNLPTVCTNESSEATTTPSVPEVTVEAEEQTGQVEKEEEDDPGMEEEAVQEEEKGEMEEAKEEEEKTSKTKAEPETGEARQPKRRRNRAKCPSYLLGVLTMSGLMGVCLLIIIGLIVFIVARTVREEEKHSPSANDTTSPSKLPQFVITPAQ